MTSVHYVCVLGGFNTNVQGASIISSKTCVQGGVVLICPGTNICPVGAMISCPRGDQCPLRLCPEGVQDNCPGGIHMKVLNMCPGGVV